jgi:carnitine 3-dehydrogenase
MTSNVAPSRIALVGAGTIGASWCAFFLARGWSVTLYDPDSSRAAFAERYIANSWPVLTELGLAENADPTRWRFTTNLKEAVAQTDYVQESVPDLLSVKAPLYEQLDKWVAPEIIIGSSTSSLKMSDLQRSMKTAGRAVVVHPFQPPHLIPCVEIVAGQLTTKNTLQWTKDIFESLGKVVLLVKREVTGHIVNRLQAALFQEASWLIREGVADVADIDRGIAFGPGLRWAIMGPFLTFHLAAHPGGIRQYLASLGPSFERMWADLGSLDGGYTPQLIEQIGHGVDMQADGVPIEELTRQRDEILVKLVKASLRREADRG